MAQGRFVSYFRVSTQKQGRSGLGLEAQRKAVEDYLNGGRWQVVAEFTEVESGKRNARPELERAFQACRAYSAKLVIAKLDRLSRNAHFLLGLKEAGVDFVAVDMPDANRLTVGIMALVAEHEGKAISERTKAALAAAKARGRKLGGNRGTRLTRKAREAGRAAQSKRADNRAADLAPLLRELREQGITSLSGIARSLTERGIATARGNTAWTPVQVARTLARL